MPKHYCVVCKEIGATLQLEDGNWICEDCAQDMSDWGHYYSLNHVPVEDEAIDRSN